MVAALSYHEMRAEEAYPEVAHPTRVSSFVLDELTVAEFGERLKRKQLSALLATELYLERIQAIDHRGPSLRSVIEINPDATTIARQLDHEYRTKGPRGALHGVPVLLKDNIDTGDKMQTTAGSLALVGTPASRDAFLVERLRAAGAVILAKTNLSEWANWRSLHSTSGWSGRGGQTRNPYALDRNPCGSSSGSGVAVSANLAMLAVGTETDGSVVCPASMNGIVGVKPTVGLISRSGIIPIGASQDTAGAMARSVTDAALLLQTLAGVDGRDKATTSAVRSVPPDYTSVLRRDGLRGARIGIARQYFTMGPRVAAVMNNCIDVMRRQGAVIVDPVEFSASESWRDTETLVLQYEFKAGLNAYLRDRQVPVKSLADCIAFNRLHREQEMPYFQQELMEMSQEMGGLEQREYKKALARNRDLAGAKSIDAALRKQQLDAFVAPTAGPAFLTDLVSGDRIDSGCASPAAVAGYPHITVPAGFVFGLPVGISFFGAAWSEPKLLRIAYAFEQAHNVRRKPRFLATAPIAEK